jgi:rare lipoprotein A
MTSNKLNVRKRTSAFLSVLLVTCLQTSITYAGNDVYFSTPITELMDGAALDAHTAVDAAPDVPLTSEELAKIPDALPVEEPFSKYGNPTQYSVLGKTYTVMARAKNFKQVGLASWYGKKFHGQRTSSGEKFDMYKLTAAHKNLPIPCYAKVTNQENGKSVIVKINDRGPFHSDRVMDVSWAAAAKLDMLGKGTSKVKIEVIRSADSNTAIASTTSSAPTTTVVTTDENKQFFVQVGAFSAEDNALSLQSKLSEVVALPIEVNSSDTNKAIHKVQVGPFVDETTANKAREYILQLAAVSNPIIIKR